MELSYSRLPWRLACDTIVGRRRDMARVPLVRQEVAPTKLVLSLKNVALTEDQFFRLCGDNSDLCMELTAQKELIIMTPVGLMGGWRENIVSARLTNWADKDGTGIVCSS